MLMQYVNKMVLEGQKKESDIQNEIDEGTRTENKES